MTKRLITDGSEDSSHTDGYAAGYGAGRAGAVLGFLVALNILNFIDRQLLQAFVVDIRRDLNLTYFEFSLLTGVFFSLSYTVAGVFMGALADRLSRPRLIAAGLTIWSGLTAVCGLAHSFAQLAFARTFVAIGEATLSPSALSMLADIFPERKHGFVSGVYYLGIPLGAGGSLILAGLLGPIIGWRGCFWLLGGIGVAFSLVVLRLRNPPQRSAISNGSPAHRPLSEAVPDLFLIFSKSASLRYLVIASTLVVFSQGALVLDQAWLVAERGYDVSRAQTVFGVLFLFAGLVGTVLGGVLSDLMHTRGQGGRMLFLAIAFVFIGPVGIAYRFLEAETATFYLAAAVGSVSIMLPYGPVVSTAADLSPSHSRAMVIAFVILMMALLGTAAGNAFTGWLTDFLSASGVREPLTWSLLASGAVSLASVPFFWLSARAYKQSIAAARALEVRRSQTDPTLGK